MLEADTLETSPTPGEYRHRYERLWAAMEARGLDALLVYGDSGSHGGNFANVTYLTGYRDPIYSYVVLPRGGEPQLLISNPLYMPFAEESADVRDIDWIGWDGCGRVADRLKGLELPHRRVALVGLWAIQKSGPPHEHLRDLHAQLPSLTWEDGTELLGEIRAIKSSEEVALMRRGAELTDATVGALRDGARAGMREHELAALIHQAAYAGGGDQRLVFMGSTPMTGTGVVFPRQEPGRRMLQPGDIVLTELSTAFKGYPGQIHRPLVVGDEVDPEYRRLFETAREVFERVIERLRPGATDDDVRDVVRPILERERMWVFDGLLHGWGLSLEQPRIDVPERTLIDRPQRETVFEAGMTLVVQPNLVTDDKRRGLQVGSVVVITDDGAQVLQQHPMELIHI